MDIKISRIHICTEECQYEHFLQYRTCENKNYDKTNKRCDLYGKETETAPSISDWSNDKSFFNLNNSADIVIPNKKVKIVFDYPFSQEFIFEFTSDTEEGFTREYLIDCICLQYKKMYDEENASVEVSSIEERMKKGGLLNREQTDGKYGIWGHDIEDLYLEGIKYDENNNIVILSIGS